MDTNHDFGDGDVEGSGNPGVGGSIPSQPSEKIADIRRAGESRPFLLAHCLDVQTLLRPISRREGIKSRGRVSKHRLVDGGDEERQDVAPPTKVRR
jgi:hypothetical protein